MKIKILFAAAAILLPAVVSTPTMAEPLFLGMTPEPYMPFTKVEPDGTWIGLEADLSNALCEKLVDHCEIKSMAWNGLLPSLNAEKVDFVVGAYSITDERKKTIDFSIPYYRQETVIIGPKSDTTKLDLIEAQDNSGLVLNSANFSGKTIGVQTATTQDDYLSKFLPKVNVSKYDTADNAVADLVANRNNYALLDLPYAQEFLKSPDSKNFEIKITLPDNIILGANIGFALRKGDTETQTKINEAMQQLIDDGTMKKIADKWFSASE